MMMFRNRFFLNKIITDTNMSDVFKSVCVSYLYYGFGKKEVGKLNGKIYFDCTMDFGGKKSEN